MIVSRRLHQLIRAGINVHYVHTTLTGLWDPDSRTILLSDALTPRARRQVIRRLLRRTHNHRLIWLVGLCLRYLVR